MNWNYYIFPSTEPTKPSIEVPKTGQKIPIGDGSPLTMNVGDNVTAASNTTITIRCPVSGVPTPSVTWQKDGVQITPGGRFSISSDNALVIDGAAVDDSAEYICSVQGVAGTDSESSTVEIIGDVFKQLDLLVNVAYQTPTRDGGLDTRS